ncbi:MAG: asparaginase domain-containing protein, partial [Deltaproteobacteria bacterium]|nr:asparaginase domain-containing protein [Deltaproteobacteria bacterium]
TGYFLNLVLKSEKPVVIVGSMRPGSALSADGPLNIYNAVIVASDKNSVGKGVLVVMNDEIHSARDVTKTNTVKVETFRSLYGPLGSIIEGKPSYYRTLARPHTMQTEFDIDKLTTLPEVGVVYAHGNMSRAPYDAFAAAGVKAIIHMGTGSGSIADYMAPVLKELRAKGILIVRASRTGSGPVVRNGEAKDDELDYIVTDDQNAAKARILLSLALTKTKDTKELQKIFWKY